MNACANAADTVLDFPVLLDWTDTNTDATDTRELTKTHDYSNCEIVPKVDACEQSENGHELQEVALIMSVDAGVKAVENSAASPKAKKDGRAGKPSFVVNAAPFPGR